MFGCMLISFTYNPRQSNRSPDSFNSRIPCKIIKPCQQLNLFSSYFLKFRKQAFVIVISFPPGNILGYAFQWKWLSKPLKPYWVRQYFAHRRPCGKCGVRRSIHREPQEAGYCGARLVLAVRPTRNHQHWFEVGHGTIWISSWAFFLLTRKYESGGRSKDVYSRTSWHNHCAN